MIDSSLAICARQVFIDGQTNEVAIIGLFEEIVAQTFPVVIQQISCFFLITRDEEDLPEHDAQIIISQGEIELFRGPLQIDFGDKYRSRVTVRLQGLILQSPGTVTALLTIDSEEIAAWQFNVRSGAGAQLPLRIDEPQEAGTDEESSSEV